MSNRPHLGEAKSRYVPLWYATSVLPRPSQASIHNVFRQIEERQCDYGVVPVENSTEGMVGQTLDCFLESPLQITGEIELPIVHHLLAGKM